MLATQLLRETDDDVAWRAAQQTDTLDGYTRYLRERPTGYYADRARHAVDDLDRCRVVAQEAVRQAEESSKNGCGFAGQQWSTHLDLQMSWCRSNKADARVAKAKERGAALQHCTAWNAAKAQDSLAGYRKLIADDPTGAFAGAAKARVAAIDDKAWGEAAARYDVAGFERYLVDVPQGRHEAKAKAAVAELKDWEQARKTDGLDGYRGFVKAWPQSRLAAEAKGKIAEFDAWANATSANTVKGYLGYIDTYPNGRFIANATQRKAEAEVRERAQDDADYERAKLGDTAKCFEEYEQAHESGRHLEEARKKRAQLERWEKATLEIRPDKIQVDSVAVSPDGRQIAAIYRDGSLAFWDAPAGRLLQRVARMLPKSYFDGSGSSALLFYAPNGRWLVLEYSTGNLNAVKLLSAEDGAVQRTMEGSSYIKFVRDGRYLLLSANQSTLTAWDTQDRKFTSRSLAESLDYEPEGIARDPVVWANLSDGSVELLPNAGNPDNDCRGGALPAIFTLLERDWLVRDNNGLYTGSADVHQHIWLADEEPGGVASGKPKSVPDDYKRRYHRPKGLDLAVKSPSKTGRR